MSRFTNKLTKILEELYYAPKMENMNPAGWREMHIDVSKQKIIKLSERNYRRKIVEEIRKEFKNFPTNLMGLTLGGKPIVDSILDKIARRKK